MINFNKLSTYSKSLFLIALSSLGFLLLFTFLFYYIIKQEKDVRESSTNQFDNEIKSLLSLNSESYLSTISEITYWDELVSFLSRKDKKWFDESIGSAINVYKVDYLGVYDLNGKIIAHENTAKINSVDFIPKDMLKSLYTLKRNNFYYKIPEGVVEIFGATIHPSNDPLRNKSNPRGYFFMARLLDDSYFQRIEKISSSKIHFYDEENDKIISNEVIATNYPLKDWNDKPVNVLHFTRKFNVNFNNTKDLFIIIAAAFIFNLVINLWFTRKWVYTPLGLIMRALETGNRKAITLLRRFPGEFGYIGNLFHENNTQRNQLIAAKEKAEESDRLKTSFLTNLSHEIRTPMNAVLGFSDLLKDDHLNDDLKQNYINVINKSGSNLISIIDDLIEMSKIDAFQVKPNLRSINLDSFLNEIYHSVKITIPSTKSVKLVYKKNQAPLSYNIITDEVKLRQIITNLITNAIKFTEKGHVSFEFYVDNDINKIKFIIKDTGIGIDEANHAMIFDRFRQVEGDYSIKAGGLGLGLAISKSYVEMLGGEISLEKSIPGKGSEFWFTIPLKEAPLEINIPSENTIHIPIIKGSKTILIAEDDNINFLLMEKIMQLKNHKIIRAKNGQEVVDLYKKYKNQIDLILMDIKMPILNGYEALAIIKQFSPNIPIVAQTAYSSNDELEKLQIAGFDNHITKPIKKDKLFELLDTYLV